MSDKKNIDVFGKYWALSMSQGDNTIEKIKKCRQRYGCIFKRNRY